MQAVAQYILSVSAATFVCALVLRLLPKSGTTGSIGKMLTGLFLAMSILSPLTKLQIGELQDFTDGFSHEAQSAVSVGQLEAKEEMKRIIKLKTEAYILDKAQAMDLKLDVQVRLNDTMTPDTVFLRGDASPYAKSYLQRILLQDLGIAKENQIWI